VTGPWFFNSWITCRYHPYQEVTPSTRNLRTCRVWVMRHPFGIIGPDKCASVCGRHISVKHGVR
jgi:hypothetical protein